MPDVGKTKIKIRAANPKFRVPLSELDPDKTAQTEPQPTERRENTPQPRQTGGTHAPVEVFRKEPAPARRRDTGAFKAPTQVPPKQVKQRSFLKRKSPPVQEATPATPKSEPKPPPPPPPPPPPLPPPPPPTPPRTTEPQSQPDLFAQLDQLLKRKTTAENLSSLGSD